MTSEVNFAGLGLAEPLLRAISESGYTTPTPIQAQAIPLVLAGGDLLAAAQTGTGKTAGFTLPVLHRLSAAPAANPKAGRPRCLILTPTRELAAQVEESVRTYGKHLPTTSMVMFGGVGINPQIQALKKRVDILVATPGRLLDHVGQKTLDLSGVEILILDEADRMLDMGFIRDIRKILALLPKQRQNLLFSATFSDEIRSLANGLLHNPGCVEVARRNTASELVQQSVYSVAQKQKRDLLVHLVKQNDWHQVLVFTRTKHGANKLAEYLAKHGIPSAAIHGNKSQSARTRALAEFKDGSLPVLVATDIAARGLDIDQLPHVVNFELPNVPEDYVHRIGRTGRAGSSGAAVSFVDSEERQHLTAIERLIKRTIDREALPAFAIAPVDPNESDARPPRPQPRQPSRHNDANAPRQARTDRPAGRQAAHPSSARAPTRPRDADNFGNRAPRSEVEANRTRPDADGNRAPRNAGPNGAPRGGDSARPTPRPDGNRRPQPRPALFNAKTDDRNR
ncbi:DEAD/DEAH box helicase [Aromatoleum bremense]|uniref:ATP-dependent RNA helicase RhlE n=1 Tax=Aromatoleum bremense TaxID=76115 RepID=A0ABX1NSU8_9RHOO|nr:DEAD/DEAH box helicase [Aromatoleum bremense]NMG15051.1 DEAD/DEAH box helicase [Aromatoleum bremense]QTQ32241.1 ATP-dependent RNA helicase [Aromatoleum bremense]